MSMAESTPKDNLRVVGHDVTRVDGWDKVTGAGHFSADWFDVAGLLYGKTLRSPYAHARIVTIDASRAEVLPGVHTIVTHHDAPEHAFEDGDTGPGSPVAPVHVLGSVVRHVGDEVAAVAAESEEIAEEALGLIHVEYEPLPFVLDAEAALDPEAPLVRGGSNIAGRKPILLVRGDVEAGLADADLIVEERYKTQATSPLALEPRYSLASWDGDALTVWKATRNVHGDRSRLAHVFGLPHEQVRVFGNYLGGGFGSKDETRLAALTALLARKAGRPVRMGYTRKEELAFGKWRHATAMRIRMGVKKDGTVTAIDSTATLNTGPYAPGFGVAQRLGYGLTYLYRCADVRYTGNVMFTNSPVAGSYRGLGGPQSHFALESLADTVAEKLGIDPLEFRRRNHVELAGQPGERISGKDDLISAQPIEGGVPFSTNFLSECLERGAERIGWKPRPGGPRKTRVNGKLRGMGVACCIYKTGQNTSSAFVHVKEDGTAELLMSVMEIGQGAWTILPQIVAETLGLGLEKVKGTFADTAITPFAHSTSGSTTTFTSGLAALKAAEDARRRIFETASSLLETPVENLVLTDGKVCCRDKPDLHIPLQHVVQRREDRLIKGEASLRAGSKTHIINSFAAHFAEVEVDPETGAIQVLRYVAVHDSGRIVNPETARGQIIGGVVQGLGYALMEETPLDPGTGTPTAVNLDTFKIPNLLDVPVIEPILIDKPDPAGPYGAKALGEPPLVPVAAAIGNAIYDATGVRMRELPITAEKLLKRLNGVKSWSM